MTSPALLKLWLLNCFVDESFIGLKRGPIVENIEDKIKDIIS
jgi:hypothetical protein